MLAILYQLYGISRIEQFFETFNNNLLILFLNDVFAVKWKIKIFNCLMGLDRGQNFHQRNKMILQSHN